MRALAFISDTNCGRLPPVTIASAAAASPRSARACRSAGRGPDALTARRRSDDLHTGGGSGDGDDVVERPAPDRHEGGHQLRDARDRARVVRPARRESVCPSTVLLDDVGARLHGRCRAERGGAEREHDDREGKLEGATLPQW